MARISVSLSNMTVQGFLGSFQISSKKNQYLDKLHAKLAHESAFACLYKCDIRHQLS